MNSNKSIIVNELKASSQVFHNDGSTHKPIDINTNSISNGTSVNTELSANPSIADIKAALLNAADGNIYSSSNKSAVNFNDGSHPKTHAFISDLSTLVTDVAGLHTTINNNTIGTNWSNHSANARL